MTSQDYIYQALRKCGQLRPGYLPGPEILADGLVELQGIFDSLNAQRTSQYTEPDYVFPVTGPGHGVTGNGQTFGGSGFQIGPTASDFVTSNRPVAIPRINLYYTAGGGVPARLPLSQVSMEEWLGIVVVSLPATNVCTTYAYDPQYPNGVIWTWPPLNGNALEVFTWGFLTPPASLATVLAFPPGYQEALVWALAERLWPLVILDIMPHKLPFEYIVGRKARTIADVRRNNAPSPRLVNDFRGGQGDAVGASNWGLLFTGV